MLLTGGHGDRFQKIEGAQIALRLSQLSCIERLALAKEQESSNQLFRRSNGNHVDSAIQTSMARLFWIEDGRGVNCDFSDAQHRRRLDGQVTEAVERAREIAVAQCCQRVAVTAQIGVEKNDRRHANHIVRRTRSLALLVGKRGVTCPTHYEKVLVITTDAVERRAPFARQCAGQQIPISRAGHVQNRSGDLRVRRWLKILGHRHLDRRTHARIAKVDHATVGKQHA